MFSKNVEKLLTKPNVMKIIIFYKPEQVVYCQTHYSFWEKTKDSLINNSYYILSPIDLIHLTDSVSEK